MLPDGLPSSDHVADHDATTAPTAALGEQLYRELRRMARRHLSPDRPGVTLQPTALVHEAFLRLLRGGSGWNNESHFLGAAAQAMRRIVVEAARRRSSRARNGSAQEPGDDLAALDLGATPEDLLTLDAALEELKRRYPRQAEVVTLRYFGGLGEEQIAAALGVTVRTIRRDWQLARIVLARSFGWTEDES